MTNRENKTAAAEFRELFGIEFDEFTRQARVKLLLALARFAEPVDITVLQFADEHHPLYERQRERLVCVRCGMLGSSRGRTWPSGGGR